MNLNELLDKISFRLQLESNVILRLTSAACFVFNIEQSECKSSKMSSHYKTQIIISDLFTIN